MDAIVNNNNNNNSIGIIVNDDAATNSNSNISSSTGGSDINSNMLEIVENSKFLDMKSIQPFSTTDEYLYAMKEDLAEWFNSMYQSQLNVNNFIDSLENGVLICEHANNVMRAAYKHNLNNNQNQNQRDQKESQQQQIYYKNDAKPQTFQSRDNISNFIKWCRNVAKVRECLMFETDDLILRKNEKNFILCLLEIARYGAKFGMKVPTIIELEQEIDNEIKIEQQRQQQQQQQANQDNSQLQSDQYQDDLQLQQTNSSNNSFDNDTDSLENSFTCDESVNTEDDLIINNRSRNDDNFNNSDTNGPITSNIISCSSSSTSSSSIANAVNDESILSSTSSITVSSLSSAISLSGNNAGVNNNDNDNNNNNIDNNINRSTSSTQTTTTTKGTATAAIPTDNQKSKLPVTQKSTKLIRNLNEQFFKNMPSKTVIDQRTSPNTQTLPLMQQQTQETTSSTTNNNNNNNNNSKQQQNNLANNNNIPNNNNNNCNHNCCNQAENNNHRHHHNHHHHHHNQQHQHQHQHRNGCISKRDLHTHVNKIANRCTCEKQFPVVKIGEGKYRIGNTKNIVFIRILRNHIMVRVGGGWDTLENYLNKHDPCRLISCTPSAREIANEIAAINNINSNHNPNDDNTSSSGVKQNLLNANFNDIASTLRNKILLTPIQTQNPANNNTNNTITQTNRKQFLPISNNVVQQTQLSQIKTSKSIQNNSSSKYLSKTYTLVDFTDAKLIIERDIEGKHSIGNILLPPTAPKPLIETPIIITSTATTTTNKMSVQHHNNNMNNNNKCSSSAKDSSLTSTPSSSCSSIATNSVYSVSSTNNNLNTNSNPHRESIIKSKVKKFINKIPLAHHNDIKNSKSPKPNKKIESTQNNGNNLNTNYYPTTQITTNRSISLDTTSSSESGTTTTTNSYEYFMANIPTYTEDNLPPRLLRKHQKKALTEKIRNDIINNNEDENMINSNEIKILSDIINNKEDENMINTNEIFNDLNVIDLAKTIQNIYQINDVLENYEQDKTPRISLELRKHGIDDDDCDDNDESLHIKLPPPPPQFSTDNVENTSKPVDTTTEDATEESYLYIKTTNSRLASATSPKAPPRTKIKYRKSKTTEFRIVKKPNTENEYEINADSLESDNEDSINEKTKLNNIFLRANSTGNPKLSNLFIRSDSDDSPKKESLFNRPDLSLDYEMIPQRDTTSTIINNEIDRKRYQFVLNYLDSSKDKYLKFFPLSDDNNNNNTIDAIVDIERENIELNDSLDEDENCNKKKTEFDDDSLLFANKPINCKFEINFVNGEINNNNSNNAENNLFKRELSTRAKWDKSPQPLEFIYYNVYNEKLKKTGEFNNNGNINMNNSQNAQLNGFMGTMRTTKPFQDTRQIATTKPVQKVTAFKHNDVDTTTNCSDAMVAASPVTTIKQKPIATVVATPKINFVKTKPISSTTNPTPSKQITTQTSTIKKSYDTLNSIDLAKRTRNLEKAKQQLYEMKKNMDAKVNNTSSSRSARSSRTPSAVRLSAPRNTPAKTEANKLPSTNTSTNNLLTGNNSETKSTTTTTTSNTRTTPRKVKKRSGERSFTTGCVMDENKLKNEDDPLEFKETFGPNASRTPRTSTQSIAPPVKRPTTQRSKSAHSVQDAPSTRQRRDSVVSNASSGANTISSGANVEYKENKAYELRKVANLKTKIATRQIENNPVFTRANPICTEIIEVTSDQTRKRLFAKKNEKVDKILVTEDQNAILSNILGTTTTIPQSLTGDFEFLNDFKTEKKSPKSFKEPLSTIPTKPSSSSGNPPKSKSASNLLQGIERTNSTLDLLELLHNQEAPKGDADQYKIMLSECEKYDKLMRERKSIETSRKQEHNSLLKTTMASANKQTTKKIVKSDDKNYKRSKSLPSYNRAPVIDIVDNDDKAPKNVQ